MLCPPNKNTQMLIIKNKNDNRKETSPAVTSACQITWIIPWPCANTSMSSTFRAVFSSALLTAGTEGCIPFCFSPLSHTQPSDLDSSTLSWVVLYKIYSHVQFQTMTLNTPERTSAMPPQAFGDDMDVPFISWVPRRVQFGTDAMAPPGALMLTPRAPSVLGPLDDQV